MEVRVGADSRAGFSRNQFARNARDMVAALRAHNASIQLHNAQEWMGHQV